MNIIRTVGVAMIIVAVMAAGVPSHAVGQTQQDALKIYLERHTAIIHTQNGSVTVDGKSLGKERILLRNGRSFVPVRLLQQLGIGSVEWNAKDREAVVSVDSELKAPVGEAVFRVGKPNLYGADRLPIPNLKMAEPFVEEGRTYVPVQQFGQMGISVKMNKQDLTLKWSEKKFEVYRPVIVSEQKEVSFTILYESDIYAPVAMTSLGPGIWSGGSEGRTILGKDVRDNGRSFTRMQVTLSLQPGINPILINGVTFGDVFIEAYWKPSRAEDVKLVTDEYAPVAFEQPQYGYVLGKQGEAIAVEGTLTVESEWMDEITIRLEQYDPKAKNFVHVGEDVTIPIQEKHFSGSFPAPAAGEYVVRVLSPKYIPYLEHGRISITWAKFVINVSS